MSKAKEKMPVEKWRSRAKRKEREEQEETEAGGELRQDPLEAILVIFGRRALIFFVWKLLEKYEKWYHFCAHAQ